MSRREAASKPRLRGVLHQLACLCVLPLGAALVLAAGSARARVAVTVYAASLVALFGVSALYHRIAWRSDSARRWMRQLDHAMIFVLIAGTYTPFALLVLHGSLAVGILIVVWAGALGGVIFQLAWIGAPRWVAVVVYVALGWAAVAALPQLLAAIGVVGLALLALGGVLYTLGGVIYATRRPDPAPAVFGFHEVFHLLVIIAAALQCSVVAFWVLPH